MSIPRIIEAARPDSPFRLSLAYTLFGTAWIVGTDFLVGWWANGLSEWEWFSSAKGLFFVLVTSGLLYLLVKRLVNRYVATERALRESQLRWQFALEGAGDGLWDWDVETNQVYYSRQWKEMLGYAENEIGGTMMDWQSRVHPDDLPEARAAIARHFRGDSPVYNCEHRLRAKNGSYQWVLARGQVVSRTPEGKPRRMIGTHADIAVRKSSEGRTADALALVKAMLQSTPVGVIAYAPDGQTAIANQTAARLVGTDMPGLLRQNFRQLDSWRQHGLLSAAEQALATNREVVCTGPLTTSFGRELYIETRFMPFEHQGGRHLLMVLNDQTALHRNVENVRLMQAAVEAAPMGWVVTDPDGVIKWVNPGFTALTGYAAEEVVGRNPRVLKSGRHSQAFYADMWATIKRGEVWTGEMFNQRKNGQLYHELMTIAPIRDLAGGIRHFVAIKTDITERKNLEQQLARAQRLESIGMLASGIAHDLNNIFSPILLSLELLKLKYPTADARRMLATVESAGQRGAGIVRQVLTFARGIEGERTEIQPKYLVKEVGQILGETLPRSIRIETELSAVLSPVLANATQLHQVLLNLAINARDAMPAGGRLVLGAADVEVDEVRAAHNPPLKPGPYVAFTVTDTGSGIPPEVLERMFEPFFTTKPMGKGTGLGLSTVYGIVRSHGGAVEVKTELGEGTTFSVLVPALARTAIEPATPHPKFESIEGAGRRLLVVDDEKTIRVVTAAALERHGFVVVTAEDGIDGLEKFQKGGNFAAVVTDLMMPGMNGYDMSREIRLLDAGVPILASSGMTGDTPANSPEAGLGALGIKTLLVKPYIEEDLLRALATELGPMPAEKKD